MFHVHINLLAVLLAAIAAWLVGAVWYGVLGKTWMTALDKVKAQFAGSKLVPMVLSFIGDVVMAFILAHAIAAMGNVTIVDGALTASFLWLGFVATTIAVNNAFAGRRVSLTLIDAGHWLAAMVAAGIVIGALG